VEAINLLESNGFLRKIMKEEILTREMEVDTLSYLLAVILQSTESCNFLILSFFETNHEAVNPLQSLAINKGKVQNQHNLETVFRLFEAQPFLRQVWDPIVFNSL
jgi:hypothetical protein